jgi:hypothetical protein
MRNPLLKITLVVVLLALVGGAYYLGTQGLLSKSGQDEVVVSTSEPEVIPTNVPSPTPQEELPNDAGEQIIAAIKSKNTQAIEGYTADMVSVRLEASSCCGLITRADAISQLSYLDPATGWDFDPTNPILVSLAAAAPNYYGSGWTVGVASNEYVFSFVLNNENKMDAYNISASYKLLTP